MSQPKSHQILPPPQILLWLSISFWVKVEVLPVATVAATIWPHPLPRLCSPLAQPTSATLAFSAAPWQHQAHADLRAFEPAALAVWSPFPSRFPPLLLSHLCSNVTLISEAFSDICIKTTGYPHNSTPLLLPILFPSLMTIWHTTDLLVIVGPVTVPSLDHRLHEGSCSFPVPEPQ